MSMTFDLHTSHLHKIIQPEQALLLVLLDVPVHALYLLSIVENNTVRVGGSIPIQSKKVVGTVNTDIHDPSNYKKEECCYNQQTISAIIMQYFLVWNTFYTSST